MDNQIFTDMIHVAPSLPLSYETVMVPRDFKQCEDSKPPDFCEIEFRIQVRIFEPK